MTRDTHSRLLDTGERMIPPRENEVSIVFARHRFAYQFAKGFVSGRTVLDIGCGTGYGCSMIARTAKRVVGIDQDVSALAYCRANYPGPNIEYRQADGATLTAGEMFEVAIAFQVIEHLADPKDFLSRVKNIIQRGGAILITTPNSRLRSAGVSDNPFHISEMNYEKFSDVIRQSFSTFEILGIGYASRSRFREFVLRSPLYALGRRLKRGSKLKKLAAETMNMTEFRLVDPQLSADAIDLLAVCRNV